MSAYSLNQIKKHICNKWECAINDGYDDYVPIINCKRCKHYSAYLYKMHLDNEDIGDYYCECGKNINLYYLCFKCKKKHYL